MQSWLDLEARFRALGEPLRHHRLDIQWGCEGEFFSVTGGQSNAATREFELLSGVAGRFLERSLNRDSEPGTTLLKISNPQHRWYIALKNLSGAFSADFPGEVRDAEGNFRGHIFVGSLHGIAEAAAIVCLSLQVEHPLRDERGFWRRLYDDFGKELVIGSILALLAAILGLFFGGA